jgi:acyl-coenzyme A synthetase/AMP-(fatty) acid ligase
MKHLRELRALLGDEVPLWNLYGPTETNVCTYFRVDDLPSNDEGTLPIGRACENGTEAFPVDDDGNVVAAAGGHGELLVTGPTVMRGYWGMPERTAEVLIPDPRGGEAHAYRTGDIVRLREDGGFDFLGRRDHQIKSRGYRVELGEVEAALNANSDLAEAVAIAVPHEEWGTAIVACAVPRPGLDVRSIDVKRRVAERLPRYMVPVRVDLLDAMPRTPNGKIDRAAVQAAAEAKPV